MLRRIIVALIGLLAVVNGPKWLFDGKRLPTLGRRDKDASKKWDRRGREEARDGATSRSVKAFQFSYLVTLREENHPGEI